MTIFGTAIKGFIHVAEADHDADPWDRGLWSKHE